MLAVKIPSVLADLAQKYTKQNCRGFTYSADEPQPQTKSPSKGNLKSGDGPAGLGNDQQDQ